MKKIILLATVTVAILGFGFVGTDTAFSAGCRGCDLPNLSSAACFATVCNCVPRPSCLFNDCLNNYNITSRCASGFEQCGSVEVECPPAL